MAALPAIYSARYHAKPSSSRDLGFHNFRPRPATAGNVKEAQFSSWFVVAHDNDGGWTGQPVTSDDEYDTDLDDNAVGKGCGSSVQVYLRLCRRMGLVPVSAAQQHLEDEELLLSNQSLSDPGCTAVCTALMLNTTVSTLELPGNLIGPTGGRHLAELLSYNATIASLNLARNNIGEEGVKCLSESLRGNKTLRRLDLSDNKLKDSDATYFCNAMIHNSSVSWLSLAHNAFHVEGGISLAHLIRRNTTIENLDISWNHIRLQGANLVAGSLKNNNTLKILNISWNGFGNNGAKVLSKSLAVNTSLRELDLICNRISPEGALSIAEAIKSNKNLKTIKLSRNPLSTRGAFCILEAIHAAENSLTRLELLDVEVNEAFQKLLQKVHDSGRSLEVLHGGRVRHDAPHIRRVVGKGPAMGDPMIILMDYIRQRNLRMMDLFTQFDKDNSWSVTRREFKRGMRHIGVPLLDHQIDRLIDKLDIDRDGEITYSELLEGQRRFRERERRRQSAASQQQHHQQQPQDHDIPAIRPRTSTSRQRAASTVSMTAHLGDLPRLLTTM